MNYIIVKYAADQVWGMYFDENPKYGCPQSYSAHSTYTGKQCNIRSSYTTLKEAEEDLKKMIDTNPAGYYDVCPMIE